MNEKELLTGVLAKIHNKTPEEISVLLYQQADDSDEETLKEDAQSLVLDEDAKRVEKLKSSAEPSKEYIKDLRDRMRSEGMDEFNKKLKAKYGSESKAIGLDLVQEIIDQISECDISDDKVKLHPAYIDLESRKNQEIETLQEKHDSYKLNQDRISRLGRVRSDVFGVLSKLNLIESQNPVVAQTHREDLLKKFEPYDYEIKDDGNHLILQNEKRVEDKHGNPVKFFDFVKDKAAASYELAESNAGNNAGNQGGGNGSGGRLDVPKTKEEYLARMALLMQTGSPEERIALKEAWDESQKR